MNVQAERGAPLAPSVVGRDLEQHAHWALYSLLQGLRGRPVGACIRQFRAWENLDPDEFQRSRQARLAEALAYAHARIPLYSTGAWQAAFSRADAANILSWPVLSRTTVEVHTAELIANPAPVGLFFRSTAGSTAPPLHFAVDPVTRAWDLAALYRGWLWHGIPPVARTLRLWSRSDGALREWVLNRKVIPTIDLTPRRLETAARILMTWRPKLLWSFPSIAFQLARYIREEYPSSTAPVVPYALLGGEQVYPFQRLEVERSLGARVLRAYGASEAAMIAMECPAGSMHILADHAHVEILRDGEPVPSGEFGDIVVTPLSNRAMPLVRYAVGDQGRLSPAPCACGRPFPVLAQLRGRASDLLLGADGRAVHGSALTAGLNEVFDSVPGEAVRQVLFEQLDQRTWRVLVESGNGFHEAIAARLSDLVRRNLGADCAVTVERVPIITRESSGKFRYYRRRQGSQGITVEGVGSAECRPG